MSAKLTVIGIDAGTFDVLDPLIEAGELPNLGRVFGAGSRGLLRSTVHPITSQAWATAFTGVNAARHGLWEFSERDESGYRLRLVNGSFRRARAVWDYLTDAGVSVGVVNVPFTWPAQQVDGFMVSGLDSGGREGQMAYPPELVDELREQFGQLELDHSAPVSKEGTILLDRVQGAVDQVTGRGEAAARALRSGRPDRRLHGRRPVPALRLGRLGEERRRKPARAGMPARRRRRRRAARGRRGRRRRRLRPRRRARRRRREPERLARASRGFSSTQGRSASAPPESAAAPSSSFLELRRKVIPKRVRYRDQAARPAAAREGLARQGLLRGRLVAHPRIRLRGHGQHRHQRARPRAARHRGARRGVRAPLRRDRRAGARDDIAGDR